MNLLTDRTQADVDRVKTIAAKGKAGTWTAAEQAEWLRGMKGAYNYTDFNRVESAVKELAAILGVTVTTVTTWNSKSVPKAADIQRYLWNIDKLRTVCSALATTPATPTSMHRMTYQTANEIEQILTDIEAAINSWYRCGEIFCGE